MDKINKLISLLYPPEEYPIRSKIKLFKELYNKSTFEEAQRVFRKLHQEDGVPLSKLTKLAIPYEAPSHPELPTMDEIIAGLQNERLSHPQSTRKLCRIGGVVVKMSYEKALVQEAEDMLWLRQNTKVRVAQVYALSSQQVDDKTLYYLFMEYTEGENMDISKWITLSDAQRESITGKLSEQLRLLRAAPSEGYYGRVNDQGYNPFLRLTFTTGKDPHGPYKTSEDFVSALYDAVEVGAATCYDDADPHYDARYSYSYEQRKLLHELKTVLGNCSGREPKLTHVDLAMRNWLVRPLDGNVQTATEYEVSIIDWGGCGWYPAWMQMALIAFTIVKRDFSEKRRGPNSWGFVGTSYHDDEHHGPRYLAKVEQFLGEPRYTEAWDFYMRMYLLCNALCYG